MSMLVAQIAPQRSTQYAALAETLAPHELSLCPVGAQASGIRPIQLGGQTYLQFELADEPAAEEARELGMLATVHTFFAYYDRIGEVTGPFLRPIDTRFEPAFPSELVTARRYRGKTNELFTHFMCNIARFSSALARRPWDTLRVLDPLAGGGTTLYTALVLGASVAGVDHSAKHIQSSTAFLKQFTREQGITCKVKRERFKGIGQRWMFTLGSGAESLCVMAHGDTADTLALTSGFRPHLIVTDLPYGIQHSGELTALLTKALPVWASLLPPSGAIAMAWESRRFPRSEMIELVEAVSPLTVLNSPPYDALAHRVDRVIKQRDVLVARPAAALQPGKLQ